MIFPFNDESEQYATALNKTHSTTTEQTNGLKQPSVFAVKGPNYMKLLVKEIKRWETFNLEALFPH